MLDLLTVSLLKCRIKTIICYKTYKYTQKVKKKLNGIIYIDLAFFYLSNKIITTLQNNYYNKSIQSISQWRSKGWIK